MYDRKNYAIVDKLTRNDQRLRSLEETESHLIQRLKETTGKTR